MTADDQAPKKWRALFYGYVQTFWCQLDTCIMLGYDEKRSMILKKEGGLIWGALNSWGGGEMPPKGRKKGTGMLLLPFMKCTYECRKNNTQPAAAQGEQLTFLSKQRWCTEMGFKKDELSSTQCKKIRRMAHLVQPTLHFAATYILHMMHILVLCTIVA